MQIDPHLGEEAILRELGARLAAVRLEQNLTQAALAEQAGVSKRSLERMESGAVATQLSGLIRVCRALGLLERLDLLIPAPAASPIVALKLQGKKRKRASGKRTLARPTKKWTWGEP